MLTLDKNHIYKYNGIVVPGVSEILEAGGFTDFSHVNDDVLEPAKKLGTAVHKACELWDREILNEGKPSDPTVFCDACKQEHKKGALCPPLIPYLNAWRKFKEDLKVSIILIEYKVYSDKWNFAGMLDRIVQINRKNILLDIKSSTTMQVGTQLQTAGYQVGFEKEEKKFGCSIFQRWGVQLRPDGQYRIHKYINRTDKSVFLGAVAGYHFKKENNLL